MTTETTTHLFTDSPYSSNGAMHPKPIALTIAGSDPTSGAGIQADLKTFAAHNVYGLSVITAITAQNTKGVKAVYPVLVEAIRKQCETLIADISFKFIKTGMIYEASAIDYVADFIIRHSLKAIIDTPFAASDGSTLMEKDAVKVFINKLIPIAHIITPNIPEAEILTDCKIKSKDNIERAASTLIAQGLNAVLIKGGHLENENSSDFFITKDEGIWLDGKRILKGNTHGTGCTLSAAIVANLALGNNLLDSVRNAKEYVTQAIEHPIAIGSGDLILGHFTTSVHEIF